MIEIIAGLIDKGHAYAAGGGRLCRRHKRDPTTASCAIATPEQLEAACGSRSAKKAQPRRLRAVERRQTGRAAWKVRGGPSPRLAHPNARPEHESSAKRSTSTAAASNLQFPHHENELAQSESYTGQPFSRGYWFMHNGLVEKNGARAKMAGSVGQRHQRRRLLQRHQPETVRSCF